MYFMYLSALTVFLVALVGKQLLLLSEHQTQTHLRKKEKGPPVAITKMRKINRLFSITTAISEHSTDEFEHYSF